VPDRGHSAKIFNLPGRAAPSFISSSLSRPCRRRSLLSSPAPPPLFALTSSPRPLLVCAVTAPSPCPPTPRPATVGRTLPRPPHHPPSLPTPSTVVAHTLPRLPHPPSPCPAVARALARHRNRLQSRFHLEFSELHIVLVWHSAKRYFAECQDHSTR
jgi:hypothetical protein